MTSTAQTVCQTTPTVVRIAAAPLAQALTDLSRQTSCPVQYEQQLVQSFRSPAVTGRLTTADALVQLVKGTGLEAHSSQGKLSVSQADQQVIGRKAASLQAQLGQAVKAQKLPQHQANTLYTELGAVSTSVVTLAKQQGFVSAAEKASYQRTFSQAEQLLAHVK
ncbi:STN domain-containing protein [Hymenobacter aerilatus]|uniref:STN domain-containing protein n=1 Tax=Hymenobacter aerilatus TaxID=2932251 RepID=A0A8T9SY04_9BACT|nr:STN domain-containing protein [Hymenobacter aerilatus]UOR06948.1 STN domain-containing protein [Hymenobacter aerilatus]